MNSECKVVVTPPLKRMKEDGHGKFDPNVFTLICAYYNMKYAFHVEHDVITQENLHHLEIDMQLDKKYTYKWEAQDAETLIKYYVSLFTS